MDDVEYLRDETRRCMQLARQATDAPTVQHLTRLAVEFEQVAAALEREAQKPAEE